MMDSPPFWDCPDCDAELDWIGPEKTTVCERCGAEWKYGEDLESLDRVQDGDPIYWDR